MSKPTAKVDFLDTVGGLKNGKAHIDTSRKLSELIDAVAEHRKKGKLTLELIVEPAGVDDDGRLAEAKITWLCRISKPEPDGGSTTFYITRSRGLSRNDPNQEELFSTEESPDSERKESAQ